MGRTKQLSDHSLLEQILEAIVSIGITEFSLSDLSQRIGLSPATLLQRFGSKKEILHEALTLANKKLDLQFQQVKWSSIDPFENIMHLFSELATIFDSPESIAKGLDILKLDIIDPKLNAIAKSHFKIREKQLMLFVSQLIELGQIPKTVTISEVVRTLEALWQGSILQWALTGSGTLEAWLSQQLSHYFSLLKLATTTTQKGCGTV